MHRTKVLCHRCHCMLLCAACFLGGITDEDDRAELLCGLSQLVVRLLARPLVLADGELRAIGLAEENVVEHDLRP